MDSNLNINTGGGAVVGSAIGGSGNTVNNQNLQFNQYAAETKQNLAEAAAEIQQLLEQLSQTYPTSTRSEQLAVADKVVEQIESNPTLKIRVINALKSGGTEAFKEAINHPLVNIVVALIEGWQEAK